MPATSTPASDGPAPSTDELLGLLRLHLATLYRSDLALRLLERFDTVDAVFAASDAELASVDGLSTRGISRLRSERWARAAESELRTAERHGARLLVRGTPGYPAALDGLPSMPLLLFVRGCAALLDELAVGVVGTRAPSSYASRQARRFATSFARAGVATVSGLARGVDGRAQEATLDAGGRTVAVLGSGLGRVYPPEHGALARRIADSGAGALVTEFPWSTAPRSFHFPQRNRLLSALSRALLVVEAGERSGSLSTVRWALDQGRSVWVVPGRVDDPGARGGLLLLRDGAAPAIDPEDVLGDLGLGPGTTGPGATRSRDASTERSPRTRDEGEAWRTPLPGAFGARVDALFGERDRWHADELLARLGDDAERALPQLAALELEGLLRRDAAGRYHRG